MSNLIKKMMGKDTEKNSLKDKKKVTNEQIISENPVPGDLPEIGEESEEMVNKEIAELSKSGYQMLKEDLLDDAIFCFNKILNLDPENNYALVGVGDAQRKNGDFREAASYYNKCLKLQPDNNYALFGLADCYKASRQFSKAIEIWEKYLKHDSKNITVLTRVADAYRKIKDFRSSKAYYLRVLELEENNPYSLIGLGHLHYDFREYEVALFYWEKMLEVNTEKVDIRVLTSLGNCHRKLKTYENGLKYFDMALDLDNNNFYALFGLADCYRGMNEHKDSLKYWSRILDQDSNNKVILTRIGDAYRNLGDLDNAEKNYNDALNIEFDSYAALGLALINKERGYYDDAIIALKGLMKSDMKNHRLYVEMADCYMSLKQKTKAIDTLMSFQRLGIRNMNVTQMLDDIKSDSY